MSVQQHGVQRTALEALSCKASATTATTATATATARKSPLLNRVYLTRSETLHFVVHSAMQLLSHTPHTHAHTNAHSQNTHMHTHTHMEIDLQNISRAVSLNDVSISSHTAAQQSPPHIQFLSLGGGLDTTYADLVPQTSQIVPKFLLDLPEVIELLQINNNNKNNNNYTLVKGDLRNMNEAMSALRCAGFRPELPCVVLIECVLSYLSPQHLRDVHECLSSTLTAESVLITYDPYMPNQEDSSSDTITKVFAFSEFTKERFAGRCAPLYGAHSDVVDHMATLYGCGWKHNVCLTMNQCWRLFFTSEQREALVKTRLENEPFDELSSLILLNSLYGVSISSNSTITFRNLWEQLLTLHEGYPDIRTRALIASARLCACERVQELKKSNAVKSAKQPLCLSSDEEKNQSCRIANVQDSEMLVQVYNQVFIHYSLESLRDTYVCQSFVKYCKIHPSVAKYVATAVKDLRNFERHYAAGSDSKLFLVECNDSHQCLGCIGLKVFSKKTEPLQVIFEISHFCVDARVRGQGIGKRLLNTAVDYARSLGSKLIQLSVLEDLVEARNLYEQKGFELVKVVDLGKSCILHHLQLNT